MSKMTLPGYGAAVSEPKSQEMLLTLNESSGRMNVQTTKLRLIRLLLNTQKENVLQEIEGIFEKEGDVDFWDDLGPDDRAAILEGIQQLERGEHVSHASVQEEIKKRFSF